MNTMVAYANATAPEPDREQLATFIRTVFRQASEGTTVSIRAFENKKVKGKVKTNAKMIRSFAINPASNFRNIINGAVAGAKEAAENRWVFSPPVATFQDEQNAAEKNLAEGFCIAVECDSYPRAALDKLSALIGSPTLIVASGGRWTNPDTGDVENKLHLYWVLLTPARDEKSLTRLKQARAFACAIVGADPSCVPIVHPLRWPGSWHMKDPANPRLCRIISDIGNEIDLDAVYDVLRNAAPAEDVTKATKVKNHSATKTPLNVYQEAGRALTARSPLVDINELAEMMEFVPNNFRRDDSYNEWNNVCMRLVASTGESEAGLIIFDKWSQKSPLYNAEFTRERWHACKPDRTGAHYLYVAAIENGWERKADVTAKRVVNYVSLDEARETLGSEMKRFVNYHKRTKNSFELFAEEMTNRPIVRVIGMPVDLGVGKTYAATEAIAESDLRFLYVVPTVKPGGLGEQVKKRLIDLGVDVELFLGRDQDDPEHDDERKMCVNRKAVALAMKARQPVQTTVCKSGKHECPYFSTCGYQKQMTKKPRVWVAASDMLYHRLGVFSKVQFIFIDEGFEDKPLRGLSANDAVKIPIFKILFKSDDAHRSELGLQLLEQDTEGGLRRAYIDGRFLYDMKKAEWNRYKELSKKLDIRRGYSGPRLKKPVRDRLISEIVLTRRIIDIINELQNMVRKEIVISGRLKIETIDSDRYITWCGLAPMSKQFRNRPIIYLDATMPSKELLKHLLPKIEIRKFKPVEMPDAVEIMQVRKSPTSAEKLIHGEHVEGHLQEMKLFILQNWMEVECKPTLVIAQKPVADWLRGQKLPENIFFEHYNAVAGVDRHKGVRLEIMIGRTQPGPESVEVQAGAITGALPDVVDTSEGFDWYDSRTEGIVMRDGRRRMVRVDHHPDPLCEALRYQIAEGEQMQAFGRARPLLRDATSLLRIIFLSDNVLPTVVDKVPKWKAPSRFVATARVDGDGMMLSSPVDMRRIWPEVWNSIRTAKRDVADGVPTLPGFVKVTYRPKAPKAKRRVGYFHTGRVADVARALEDRLGVPVEITP